MRQLYLSICVRPLILRPSTSQVRQVLQEIAREIEGLAAGSAPANDEPGGSRRERLASLLPKPVRLSPREERVQLRRQFGLEP
jgi:hypothetical protein